MAWCNHTRLIYVALAGFLFTAVVVANPTGSDKKISLTDSKTTDSTKPLTPEEKKAINAANQTVLNEAITALTKDFETYWSNPDAKWILTHGNYFKKHACPTLTPEAIFEKMNYLSESKPPHQAAYICWELMSGLPEELNEKQIRQLSSVYRQAPFLLPRPGLSKDDKKRWDRMARGTATEERIAEVNNKVAEEMAPNTLANGLITLYRDALYKRLPATTETIFLGMQEAYNRIQIGQPALNLPLLAEPIRAIGENEKVSSGQKQAIKNLLRQMKDKQGPSFYTSINPKTKSTAFGVSQAKMNTAPAGQDGLFKVLSDLLDNQASGGGLTMKKKKGK